MRDERTEGGLSGREVCHDERDKEMVGTLKERNKTGWNEKEIRGIKKDADMERRRRAEMNSSL